MEKLVKITAKKDGFRRCGVAHSAKGETYPIDKFSEDEIEIMQREPMLVVQIISDEEDEQKTGWLDTDLAELPREEKLEMLKELAAEMDMIVVSGLVPEALGIDKSCDEAHILVAINNLKGVDPKSGHEPDGAEKSEKKKSEKKIK